MFEGNEWSKREEHKLSVAKWRLGLGQSFQWPSRGLSLPAIWSRCQSSNWWIAPRARRKMLVMVAIRIQPSNMLRQSICALKAVILTRASLASVIPLPVPLASRRETSLDIRMCKQMMWMHSWKLLFSNLSPSLWMPTLKAGNSTKVALSRRSVEQSWTMQFSWWAMEPWMEQLIGRWRILGTPTGAWMAMFSLRGVWRVPEVCVASVLSPHIPLYPLNLLLQPLPVPVLQVLQVLQRRRAVSPRIPRVKQDSCAVLPARNPMLPKPLANVMVPSIIAAGMQPNQSAWWNLPSLWFKMDGVRGIRWWQKGREKVVGIFSLPFKKPPLGLPWTNHQYFGPAWGSFFCRRKSSIDSNSFGQSPSPNKPGTEQGCELAFSARRWVEPTWDFFGVSAWIFFAANSLSCRLAP